MYKIKCRCGASEANFNNDIGEFYVTDCCEKAGYNEKGELVNPPKEAKPETPSQPENPQQPQETKAQRKAREAAEKAAAQAQVTTPEDTKPE